MYTIQYIQVIGNSILSIIAFSSFIIIANYMRLTKSKCLNNAGDQYAPYSCTAYHSFQANAAFSFFLIFVPWIGMIGALRGKKICTNIYLAILSIALLTYIITCSIILGNHYARELWKTAKTIDSTDISAIEEAYLASYNMCIAQIILIWFFLVGTAVVTYLATKKEEEDTSESNQPLRS